MKILYMVILLCLASCSDSSKGNSDTSQGNSAPPPPKESPMIAIPDNRDVDHYKILFIGNSHVGGGLANIVQKMFENNLTTKLVTSQLAPGSAFLEERISDGITLSLIHI